jgi:hypothetical protein
MVVAMLPEPMMLMVVIDVCPPVAIGVMYTDPRA